MKGILLAMLGLFDYDAKTPLDVQQKLLYERGGVKVYDLSYASPKGGRVTAYLVEPAQKGRYAGIVYQHWGQGDRSSFLAEAMLLGQIGAVSVLLDAPWLRPGARPPAGFDNPEAELASWAQAVTDIRRAVDHILARGDVDASRLGYVGHSYGATMGGAIAANERRFRALVLMGGFASLTDTLRRGEGFSGEIFQKLVAKDKQEHYLEVMKPIDAVDSIGRAAPAAVFLQFARADRFITERQGKEYERAASEPKLARWYEGGHEFNDGASLEDRGEWLAQQLRLRPFAPVLKKRMSLE
jgi:dienelactone hydrolase